MRTIRLDIEDREKSFLSPAASFSAESKGAEFKREKDDIRTLYMQDRDRIIHSEYFRRLKDKAQVIMLSVGDFRTRLTHTLEVMQIARSIARALRLNEDLTEAIALGHDLGHSPFGHAGEKAIAKYYKGFHHSTHSLRVVEHLEKGKGLNLTFEVRDGIVKHTKGKSGKLIADSLGPATNEGMLVRISDTIAYSNHDVDDAIRYGLLKFEDIPKSITKILGHSYGDRVDAMVMGVIKSSMEKMEIDIDEKVLKAINDLRAFMFKKVYESKIILEDSERVYKIVSTIFEYLLKHKEIIEEDKLFKKANIPYKSEEELVKDYVAHLTDSEAIALHKKITYGKLNYI
ncbi:deoxyguanosinetriphosphate triphosphohydrolase [Brachyspira aalborgi]|mgnify:FL=1|uniref:Deoxyguanosinetriphosphate triphosphohydrolase n=1 Tax=Brachyspira aalborgi TaxID=29522 RepID=A0AB38Q144_9SPIR|nr:deoxyguanosinetriphosphate triphosphohydrolase [Brachyspira aalborgi]TXJ17357.1 deoxyguanosinetriphosphate triphosphohydrolase [Brachyspira aalborgi]TXJ22871.1 deoxyguanosinetriphosphate triphosphohydrolase [Brachyspira aalborgi]TXJ26744.1 deoxyguanosinetriphosphate triphosphohydrolase [Brachyspira aalborgi]TXJ51545.1 deoxyguanosinetriphosphate triphosphohydrolase [Brachyspira aalborgi]